MLTCAQVKGQNPLALGLPAWYFDVHLIHVFFGGKRLVAAVVSIRTASLFPLPNHLGALLPNLSPTVF